MKIEYFTPKAGLYRVNKTQAGDSVAFFVDPRKGTPTTIMLSRLSGKTKIQYTLGTQAGVMDDTADWYDNSDGYVTESIGSIFDTPISYFRVVVETQTDSYKIEALQ